MPKNKEKGRSQKISSVASSKASHVAASTASSKASHVAASTASSTASPAATPDTSSETRTFVRKQNMSGSARKVASQARRATDEVANSLNSGLTELVGHGREAAIIIVFLVAIAIVLINLGRLMILDAPVLSAMATEQRTVQYEVTARRGTIFDRDGNVLAVSVDKTTIYVNPSEVIDPARTADALREILGGTSAHYEDIIRNSASPTFNYVLKKGDPAYATAMQEKNAKYVQEYIDNLPVGDDVPADVPTALTGIHYLPETERVYPYGNVGAQVIGTINEDGYGVSGIEQTYDTILRGVDGYVMAERGKDGRPIPGGVIEETPVTDGQDIVLSLDMELQAMVESRLAFYGEGTNCDNANTILLDGTTGEIYATASLPLYDRENMSEEDFQKGAMLAKSITYGYEPGSTFKSVTAAAAIDSGIAAITDEFYCPSSLEYDDYVVKDAILRGDETMSLTQIITSSSNVGMSLLKERIPDVTFNDYISKAGFGQATHVDYPGESVGMVLPIQDWSNIQRSNMSFGQGILVSPLQIASFYGAIANHGVRVQPHFLLARPSQDAVPTYAAKRIMSDDTANKLETMLRTVVTEGGGRPAAIDGYETVGKTGTAEKALDSGLGELGAVDPETGQPLSNYIKDNYISSFVGYIANSSTNMVCLTSFDNPTLVSAPSMPNGLSSPTSPLFAEIMSFVADRYIVTNVDALYEAKAAANAAALAGEGDMSQLIQGRDIDAGSGNMYGNGSNANSGDQNENSRKNNEQSDIVATPRGYATNDEQAASEYYNNDDVWFLDTTG